ncbi:MAG TPA: hypothetical protein VFU89_02520, partial [Rhabdochlamydiaceae bacterium]|nr:hypothetical protein [Rhabdochlamydiaceae bacterium]
ATTKREFGRYTIHYSDPILPTEDPHIQMREVLAIFEASIKERPHEWLWIHNRWKQQQPGKITKKFRHDAVAFIFPDKASAEASIPQIRALYPREHITAFVPSSFASSEIEVKSFDELLAPDYRFKLLVDFTQNLKAQKHFSKLSALNIGSFNSPQEFFTHASR